MNRSDEPLRILQGTNPYAFEVQGKANEPICVLNLLNRAGTVSKHTSAPSQREIVDRLDANAPRVAIITGSPDHPAHVTDEQTMLRAAAAIWHHGGIPFAFGIPVMCDGTAQSNMGMCYSLESRNLVARMVANQMESHSYHGAFVLQGCDKTPFAILNALSALDRSRQQRGEAPVFASFAPAHVLRGGTIPEALRMELLDLSYIADREGHESLGDDLRMTLNHILQCTSNQAFQGVFARLVQAGLLSPEKHKEYEKQLASQTCHVDGGICAFNGTGNSCRFALSALGMVHPAVEFLTQPANEEAIDQAVSSMLAICNNADYSVSNLVRHNRENAVRVHCATGGSTNLMMHLVSAFIHAGLRYSIHDYQALREENPVPDIMNYSLTEGRDIFTLAQQCQRGEIAGVATVLYELQRHGLPVSGEAPTMAGRPWSERIKDGDKIAASNVKDNPVLLSTPKRPHSGIDVLTGNFFESAVVKISGMSEEQIRNFDNKIAAVLYFENEEAATQRQLDQEILKEIVQKAWFTKETLIQMYQHNLGVEKDSLWELETPDGVFQQLIEDGGVRLAIVIAGQGPEAFGMPEMFTPMQHLNHNTRLKKLCTILSDGRYSGVSYGAAIGHVTPEAYNRGGILYLQNGDLLHLQLRQKQINLLDRDALEKGEIQPYPGNLAEDRHQQGEARLKVMEIRRGTICPLNGLSQTTDASHGVVPLTIWDWTRHS